MNFELCQLFTTLHYARRYKNAFFFNFFSKYFPRSHLNPFSYIFIPSINFISCLPSFQKASFSPKQQIKLFIFISPTFYQKSLLILHHLSTLWKLFSFCIHYTPVNKSICSMTTTTSVLKQEKQHWCLTSKQPTQITLSTFQESKAISCLVPAEIKISVTFIAFVTKSNKPK